MVKTAPCQGCGTPTSSIYGYCKSNPTCIALNGNARNRAHYHSNLPHHAARAKAYRIANPEKARETARASQAKRKARLAAFKVGKSCVDCGLECSAENYVAFDWDHRPGTDKQFEISQSFRRKRADGAVEAEIAKCDLRCRNCHAVITHRRHREKAANGQ